MALTTIQTYSGKIIDPFNLKMDDIDIRDIAHSLSMMPRFAGHTQTFYSVAMHSIRCCVLAVQAGEKPEKILLELLLHDAAEAYIMDMPSPIKHRIDGYEHLERDICAAISNKFEIDLAGKKDLIKKYDEIALKEELNAVMWGNLPCDAWYISSRGFTMDFIEMDFLNIYSKWKRTK
jgi:uncharacterized protein